MKKESILAMLAGIVSAFIVCGIFIAAVGADPIFAYGVFFSSAFGSIYGIADTLTWATPLILTSLGLVFAFRARYWNIGSEGQLLMGAVAAAWLGIVLQIPSYLFVPLIFVSSFALGSAWAFIPGYLKAKLRVNEIITTLMMNFVALFIVSYLVEDLLKEGGALFPRTQTIAVEAQLPILIHGTRLHVGILIAIVLAAIVYLVVWKTVLGYSIRVTGKNPIAARYGGVNTDKYLILSTILSGGLAGIAGMGEVCGVHYRLVNGISPGYGYFAIIVALIGRLHPIGVILAGILFGGIIVGSTAMTGRAGIPGAFMFIIQALILIFMLAFDSLLSKWKGE